MTKTTKTVAELFLDYSDRKLVEMTKTLTTCLNRLNDRQIWQRHGPHENAVGNLVLHLCGNMRQWIMHGVDNQPDVRIRDEEFATTGGLTGAELAALFTATTEEARGVLASLPHARLTDLTSPQQGHGEFSVLDVIYQVVGHVQLHTGQIVLLTKQMVGTDLNLTMPRKR
jgi:uncharacterized damage-inducible protein DinB